MRRFLLYFAILLVGVGAGGGAWYAVNLFGLFDAPLTEADKDAARKGLLDNLKDAVRTGGDAYLGASVEDLERDGEQLTLVGQIDSDAQAVKLKEAAEFAISGNAAWKKAFPSRQVITTKLTVVPLRSQHLVNLRNEFAAAATKDAADPKIARRNQILSRTRLNDLAPVGKSIEVRGLYLMSKADEKKEEEIRVTLRDAVKAYFDGKGSFPEPDVKTIHLTPGVVTDLTRAVRADAKFAGVAIGNPSYDGSGVLRLSAVTPKAELKAELVRAIQEKFAKTEAARTAAVKEGLPSCDVEVMAADLERLPGRTQEKAAASKDAKDDVLRRTRFTGVSASSDEGDALSLVWHGVRLATAKEREETERKKQDEAFLEGVGRMLADALEGSKVRLRHVADVRLRDDPIEGLQRKVEEDDALEGVVVGRPRFDGKGKLQIPASGTAAQKAKLDALVTEAKAKFDKQPDEAGGGQEEQEQEEQEVAAQQDEKEKGKDEGLSTMSRARKTLQEQFAAHDEYRYVRIKKLGQKQGAMVLSGVALLPNDKNAAEFRKGLEKYLADNLPKILEPLLSDTSVLEGLTYSLASEKDDRLPFKILQKEQKPAGQLAKAAAADESLDGLLVRDAWFDATGGLTLSGLFGVDAGQKEPSQQDRDRLTALCEKLDEREALIGPRDKDDKAAAKVNLDQMKVVPWRDWQAKLSQVKDDKSLALRQVRVARVRWVTEGDATKVAVSGISVAPGIDAETIRTKVRDWVEAQIGERVKDWPKPGKPDYSFSFPDKDFQIEAEFFPRMRELARARGKELDGALIGDVNYDAKGTVLWAIGTRKEGTVEVPGFDDKGKLRLVGVVTGEAQKALLKKEAEAASNGRFAVDVSGLTELNLAEAAGKFQAALAADDKFELTRIDRVGFAYPEKAGAAPQLRFHGVTLKDSKGKTPGDAELKKKLRGEAGEALTVKDVTVVVKKEDGSFVPLSGDQSVIEFDVSDVKTENNPRGELQKAVADREDLDGVLIRKVAYAKDGKLQIEVYAEDKKHEADLTKLVRDTLAGNKALILAPANGTREPVLRLSPLRWKEDARAKTWTAFKRVLQEDLSGKAPAKRDESQWALRQTGLRRVYFEYDEKDDRAYLSFKGLTLYSPHLAGPGDEAKAAKLFNEFPARRKAMLSGEDKEVDLKAMRAERLKAALGKTSRDNLQDDFDVRLAHLDVRESPHADLQNNLPEVLSEDLVAVWGLYYDKDGELKAYASNVTPRTAKAMQDYLEKSKAFQALKIRPAAEKQGPKDEDKQSRLSPPSRGSGLRFVSAFQEEKDRRLPVWDWQAKLAGSNKAALTMLRLESRGLRFDEKNRLVLKLKGVTLYEGKREELDKLLRSEVTNADLSDLDADYPIDLSRVVARENPVFGLQRLANRPVRNRSEDAADGLLFYNARFDKNAALVLDVHLAADGQGAIADEILKSYVPPDGLLAPRTADGGRALREQRGPVFDWQDMLTKMRKSFASHAPARRTYLKRAYFGYPGTDPAKIDVRWGGVCIEKNEDGLERAAILEGIQKGIEEYEFHLPKVIFPGFTKFSHNTQEIRTPGSPLIPIRQDVIADKLDGVGVTDVYFDEKGKVVVSGIWNTPQQSQPTRESVGAVLVRQRVIEEGADFTLGFAVVRSDEVLARLREWTADHLEEAYVRRLYYSPDGALTIECDVLSTDDRDAAGRALAEILKKHPQFGGRFLINRIAMLAGQSDASPSFVMLAAPPAGPLTRSQLWPAAVPPLRARVQMSRDDEADLPPRQWDGIVLRRGYFSPSGVFVLDGLTDNPGQRTALVKLIDDLRDEAPYNRAFGKTYQLKFVERPLAPLLRGLRQVIPAYPSLDGMTLIGAGHDVDNRLMLRFTLVGQRFPAGANATLLSQIQEDARYQHRVDAKHLRIDVLQKDRDRADVAGPLRLYEIDRVPRNAVLAERLVREAISTLRLGVGDLSSGTCAKMSPAEVRAHRLKYTDEALRMTDVALLHGPNDPTAWYLRAICYLVLEDELVVKRDLRRMIMLERSEVDGRNRRIERLEMLEHLQGDFRRQLEIIRKRVALDMDKGVPPLQLKDLASPPPVLPPPTQVDPKLDKTPQGGELKLDKTRFTYGALGSQRVSDRFLPGDTVYVAGVVKGLTARDDGFVVYKTSYEILKKGDKKPLLKADPQEQNQKNWLGGGDVPFVAIYSIPRDNQAPGSYTMKIAFTDAKGNPVGTLSKDFTVEKTKLGFINTGLVGSPVAVVGDPRALRYTLVGFELDKGKNTDVTVSVRVLDDKGKQTVAKPLTSTIKNDGASLNGVMAFRETPIETNKPGRYTIELTARCNVSKAEAKETLPLTVVEVE